MTNGDTSSVSGFSVLFTGGRLRQEEEKRAIRAESPGKERTTWETVRH